MCPKLHQLTLLNNLPLANTSSYPVGYQNPRRSPDSIKPMRNINRRPALPNLLQGLE